MRRFEKNVAIVTGGAQGIGAATIRSFSKEGANVIILDQDIEKMKEVMHETHSNGGKGQAFQCDTVIDTHLKGSFICSQEAQKYMVEQGCGKIVMLSSRSALGKRGQINYATATAKAGIQGMTKTMAIELGPLGINVNAVAPGFIETQMTKNVAKKTGVPYEEIKENAIRSNAIKRVGTPEDVANLILFLSSSKSDYITGQTVYIAGNVTN